MSEALEISLPELVKLGPEKSKVAAALARFWPEALSGTGLDSLGAAIVRADRSSVDAGVYYILGTSLAEGHGYRILSELGAGGSNCGAAQTHRLATICDFVKRICWFTSWWETKVVSCVLASYSRENRDASLGRGSCCRNCAPGLGSYVSPALSTCATTGASMISLRTSLAQVDGYRISSEPGSPLALDTLPLLPAFIALHQSSLGTTNSAIVAPGRRNLTPRCSLVSLWPSLVSPDKAPEH